MEGVVAVTEVKEGKGPLEKLEGIIQEIKIRNKATALIVQKEIETQLGYTLDEVRSDVSRLNTRMSWTRLYILRLRRDLEYVENRKRKPTIRDPVLEEAERQERQQCVDETIAELQERLDDLMFEMEEASMRELELIEKLESQLWGPVKDGLNQFRDEFNEAIEGLLKDIPIFIGSATYARFPVD